MSSEAPSHLFFNLGKCFSEYNGYYFDQYMNLYSVKSGGIKKLYSQVNYFASAKKYPHTLRQLRKILEKDFEHWLKTNKQEVIKQDPSKQNQPNIQPIVTGNYIVAIIQNGIAKFSSAPKVHLSLESAKNEVERLARENPGNVFSYFKCMGVAKCNTIEWQ